MTTHDTATAVAFLQLWRENGPWMLTAIHPDTKKIETRTFTDPGEMAGWIEPKQGVFNLYFGVNPTRTAMNVKAKKGDIAKMTYLHVDVDPRAGEDFESEKVRILNKLQAFQPAPTIIVFSGGGYQAFWKLETPVDVPTLEDAEMLEAYNLQLELVLGGDHCHNLDRIMRLPGTVNMPDERKRKKGRVPSLATLVCVGLGNSYELSDFQPAARARVQSNESGPLKVVLSGNLPRISDLAELPDTLTDRTKRIIVQGDDPDNPTAYASRSEALFAVCCALVKADCEDDTIAAIITDPDYGISASVLDKPRPTQYAARQIRRAREFAIDPHLMEMNDLHAVIADDGGRCRIATVVEDNGRQRVSRQGFEDFRNRYRHIYITVGHTQKGAPITKSLGTWWIDHPQRRQYDTIVFAPEQQVEGAYNLWKGFKFEALPGDKHLSFMDHVRANICAGNDELFTYVWNWLARAVQKPGCPGETAIVLRGEQGTGKSFFAKHFGALLGQHFLQVSDSKHLVGAFNGHLRDCVVLFGDEAFYAGDKRHEAILKMLITEETLMIEDKGVNAAPSPNYTHLIMASNSTWVVPVGPNERRFCVLDVASAQRQNADYFKAIAHDLVSGGYENLLYALKAVDLSGWDHRTVPQTKGLEEQRQFAVTPAEQCLMDMLAEGITYGDDLLKGEGAEWFCLNTAATQMGMNSQKLLNAFIQMGVLESKTTMQPKVWADESGNYVPKGHPKAAKLVTGPRMYRLKPLDELRKRYAKLYAGEWSIVAMWSRREVEACPF